MTGRPAAALVAALALAGCAAPDEPGEAAAPAGSLPLPAALEAEAPGDISVDPAAAAAAPSVYMSIEADPGRPVSLVFAIDAAGDAGPADDPAIRLTPEGGRCNPQELSRYGDRPGAPVFGPEVAARGVDPRDLPEFMAVAVSRRMIDEGLAATPDDTRPQNVCTRKLWERLAVAQTRAAAAGQLE